MFASELAFHAANEALQIAGGIGFSKEYPYEQAVRDSRINLIFEGTNEILRALIALMGLQQPGERLSALGKAFKDPIHSLGAIGGYLAGRAKRTITKPKLENVHVALVEEADLVATLVHDLALAVERTLIEHGKGIVDMQFIQERMANAAIDIFRFHRGALADHLGDRASGKRGGGSGAQLDCARIFVPLAYRRARRNIRAIATNQNARLKAIAERSLSSGELGPESPTDV